MTEYVWYNQTMKRGMPTPHKRVKRSYTLGRSRFARISAIEGIGLTPEMDEDFIEFDRAGLPPAERRKAIDRKYGKRQ